MEVHHHPTIEKKNFKEYFLEFLMIFLAVTMGFFAESIREHLADNSKEKQYINSMIADLKGDTAGLREVIDASMKKVVGIDTMVILLDKPALTVDEEKQLYILNSRYASNIARMDWHDGTIRQLLTSGNLRLMSEQGISDSIMSYYGTSKDLATGQADILYESVKRIFFGAEDIFDRTFTKRSMNKDSSFSRRPMPDTVRLLTKEKTVLRKYAQMAITMQALINNYLSILFGMYKRAENLLLFLQAKYDIK
ncbi:MAG TPA: hypothetical protein VHZ50_05510 [Puia sp.]|nr:hypothetical protein [Puia sp.]